MNPTKKKKKKGKEEVKLLLFADHMIVHKNHPKGSTKIILEVTGHNINIQNSISIQYGQVENQYQNTNTQRKSNAEIQS